MPIEINRFVQLCFRNINFDKGVYIFEAIIL